MKQRRKLSFHRNARCRYDLDYSNVLEWNDYSLRIIVYHPALQSVKWGIEGTKTIITLSMQTEKGVNLTGVGI